MTEALSISIENYSGDDFSPHPGAYGCPVEGYLESSRGEPVVRDRHVADPAGPGLVNYEPYGFVTLTAEGEKIASRVLRRHEALRDFMVHVLAIDEAEADKAACHMEHGISSRVVERFVEFADFVKTCPRAGAKWVHGFGYRCEEAAVEPQNCERCIEQCLEDVRKNQKKGTEMS
jgi:Mn-dependent DtxR family transcriptional regulator